MSQSDPFDPFTSDRTIIKPSPANRRARVDTAASAASAAPETLLVDALFSAEGAPNALLGVAAPLLQLGRRLRAMPACANPGATRDAIARAVQQFDTVARAAGAPNEHVIAARYVLCTYLDEAASGTPWGAGVWSSQSLLVMFHNETSGGEKVFQLLSRLATEPRKHLPLLELMHVVLALGFQGRYQLRNDGQQQLAALRRRLLTLIQKERGEPERELSQHWAGVVRRARATDALPLWVVGAAIAALLTLVFVGLLMLLNRMSDPVFTSLAALRAPTPKPLVVRQAARPRLAEFLAPEIKAGQVSVDDRVDRSVVTIRGDGFFEPGSAEVAERVKPLLASIAAALNKVNGNVLVTGHTDSRPIVSVRYPSNWQLSQERADSVKDLLATTVSIDRLKAEGRGDAEPVAPNDSPAGRSRNRRVEITLFARPAS